MKHWKLGLTALGGMALVSCGKLAKEVGQAVQEPGLMKTWGTRCGKSEILDVSAKSLIAFSGSEAKRVYEVYPDNACGHPAVRVTETGSFDLRGGATGGKAIDLHLGKVTVTAVDPEGKKLLERVDFCGHKEWAVGQPVDVTGAAGGLKCPLSHTPRNEFDIYQLEGDTLYLGAGKFFGGGAERAEERPKKLDKDKPYFKENRAL